jgi:cell division protein FtsQ
MPEPDQKPRQPDEQEPSPYLRRAKRVEVRRAAVRWRRVLWIGIPLFAAAGGMLGAAAYGVHNYLSRSPRFVLSEGLQVTGAQFATTDQIGRVFAGDVGRSIFDAPLQRRREQLLALPWVESAWVMRGWPNRLRVHIAERKPVAFVRTPQGALGLIDRAGVLMPRPRGKFPLPVLIGVDETTPLEERRRRVARMLQVLAELDRDTPPRAAEVSEIDLTDAADAAVTVPAGGGAVLVHLGETRFLERYRYFLHNIESWREQYGAVHSVDLRYEKQVIVR